MGGRICAVAFAVVLFGSITGGRGAIIGTGGSVVVVSAPPSVRTSQYESDTEIRAFAERQNVALPAGLSVDITSPGTSPSVTDLNLSPGVIPTGTVVSSFLIHYDVVGSRGSNPIGLTGSITFDTDVLGIIVLRQGQLDTDSFPGLPSVMYAQQEPNRGLDLAVGEVGQGSNDEITLSDDRRTVLVNLRTGTVQDEARIITAVPEPAFAPLTMALCGIGCRRRRHRSR